MAREVLNHIPGTTFHVVGGVQNGEASYAEQLHGLASDLGIASRVTFWGFLPDPMARDLLCASDLYVLPTREEGFGLSVAEAQACEVPVLTSAIEPLDEVVDAGHTGYLIDPEDFSTFAVRAIALLENEPERKSMGQAGRRWVVERFGKQAWSAKIQCFYDEVMQGTHPSARDAT
jgi:glycosyltransferase involved in cell wall biosynthesis